MVAIVHNSPQLAELRPPATASPEQVLEARSPVPRHDRARMKIFFDEAWLPAGAAPVVALYPFLLPDGEDDDGPTATRYDRWLAHGREVLQRVPLEEADAAIFPANGST